MLMADPFETDPIIAAADPELQAILKSNSRPSHGVLLPEGYQFVIDTREQRPWNLEPAVRKGLQTGDYSVTGLEDLLCVERKSLPDLLGVMSSGRSRFERELARMAEFERAFLVVEASWETLARGNYHVGGSRFINMHPNSVMGSIYAWISRFNVRTHFAADRLAAEEWVRGLMVKVATDHSRGRWPWKEESCSKGSTSGASSDR